MNVRHNHLKHQLLFRYVYISLMTKIIQFISKHPYITLFIFLGIFFFPILVQNKVFYCGDIFTIYYPFKTFWFKNLVNGVLPLWDPNIYSGYPIFADISLGNYYLPSYLLLLSYTMKGISMLVVLHFFLASVFMYKFGRLLGISKVGSLASSVAFSMSGILVNYIADPPRLFVVSIYPLFFYTLLQAFKRYGLFWIIVTGVVLSLQIFAGHIQYVFIELLATPFLILYKYDRKEFLHRVYSLIGIVGLGIVISSIALLPAFEILPFTTRSDLFKDISVYRNFSLHPITLIRFIFAHFWGIRNEGSAWGVLDTSSIGYIGFMPLLLIILNVKKLMNNRNIVLFISIAFIGLLISFGVKLFFFRFFIDTLPLFRIFRNPMAFLVLYTLFMSVLAGYAIDLSYMDNRIRRYLTSFFIVCLILAIFLYTFAVKNSYAPSTLLTAISQIFHKNLSAFHTLEVDFIITKFILMNLMIVSTLGAISFFFKKKEIFLLVFFLDLLVFTRGNMFLIDYSIFGKANPIAEYLMNNLGSARFISSSETVPYSGLNDYCSSLSFQPPFSKEGKKLDQSGLEEQFHHELNLIPPNFATHYGISTITGATTFVLKDYAEIFRNRNSYNEVYQQMSLFNPYVKETKSDINLTKVDFSKTSFNDALFDDLAVKYIVTDRDLYLKHHKEVNSYQGITIYENTNIKPRAIVTDASNHIVEIPQIVREDPNIVEIKTAKKGTLLLQDMYYPGWKAFIDGRETRVLPYNNISRMVVLEHNASTVTLIFDPLSFKLGACISIFSLLLSLSYIAIVTINKYA